MGQGTEPSTRETPMTAMKQSNRKKGNVLAEWFTIAAVVAAAVTTIGSIVTQSVEDVQNRIEKIGMEE